jgi:hypothetical protein
MCARVGGWARPMQTPYGYFPGAMVHAPCCAASFPPDQEGRRSAPPEYGAKPGRARRLQRSEGVSVAELFA